MQDTGGQFDIKYGTGAVHGRVVTDVLRFSEPPIVVPDQGFGLATEHSADFASASCDGIFVRPRTPHAVPVSRAGRGRCAALQSRLC